MTVVGVLIGLAAGLPLGVWLARRRKLDPAPLMSVPVDTTPGPPSSAEVIDALPVAVAVLDRDDAVVARLIADPTRLVISTSEVEIESSSSW